jgi:hypothetical protein
MLPRAARPERPERLPALRPAAPGRRALSVKARLLPLLLVAAVAGCGGDDEPADTTRGLPELSPPSGSRTGGTPTVERTGPSSTTVDPATETLPPEGPPPSDTAPADTPESDTAPPADSPAERFEEYCNENPGACG